VRTQTSLCLSVNALTVNVTKYITWNICTSIELHKELKTPGNNNSLCTSKVHCDSRESQLQLNTSSIASAPSRLTSALETQFHSCVIVYCFDQSEDLRTEESVKMKRPNTHEWKIYIWFTKTTLETPSLWNQFNNKINQKSKLKITKILCVGFGNWNHTEINLVEKQ
jgi:hypothetical protein